MPCFHPITAFQNHSGGPLSFKKKGSNQKELQIPCGQCIGCRLEHSRQWAMRCVNEAKTHKDSCFITLTYDDDHLPQFGSLDPSHLAKFFDRMRKAIGPFRYYACGEYGDNTKRAHYHACIFGIQFDDKRAFRKIGEHTLYISEKLNKLWGHGNTSIGHMTFETAAYTARYVMKKKFGKGAPNYMRLDEETGELIPLVQPFAVMSLRPAIGLKFMHAYHDDIYGKDYLVLRGQKMKPPKYYDTIYDKIEPEKYAKIKEKRVEEVEDLTYNELRAREKITRARLFNRRQV